jgi:hypothetical protein
LSAAFLAVLSVVLSQPATSAGLRVVDLTGEFDRFAMTTTHVPDDRRVTLFEDRIGPIADGFYSRDRRPGEYDERVLSNLKSYPERRADIRAVTRKFSAQFAAARRSFQAVFGPVTSDRPVYLIDSLGELDGGTRELEGKNTLLFGADVIAEVHGAKDMIPFFHHELFHLFQEKYLGRCGAVWCALWEEGMATYVASRLDPGADDDALILNLPKPIRSGVEAHRARAVCAVTRLLDSTRDEDYSALFLGDGQLPGFPSRMGYYIGYLVASDIARTHDLHAMARMSFVEARPLIDESLQRMAVCDRTSRDRVRQGE